MAKDFTLQEGQGVDENLRPVRINGENTSLEVANDGNGAKVKGDLTITGNIPNVNTNTIVSSNLNIESNIIKFGASDSPVFVKTDGHIEFDGCGVGFDLVNPTYDATDTGGSNPTLTTDANHVDIISIFYDCDAEIAYGVASLDFQF